MGHLYPAGFRVTSITEITLSVRLDRGKLTAQGTTEALSRWVPELRAVKPELAALLASTGDLEADTATSYRWRIALPNGDQINATFTPPATLAEVRGWHPDALSIVPLPAILEPVPTPAPGPALVTCRTCDHWRRDLVGDGSGLGRCLAYAPASREPGACWPRGSIVCREHLEVTQ